MLLSKDYPDVARGEELAINVGSNCDFTSDLTSLTWLSDREYSPGGWGYLGGEGKSTTSEIKGTFDGPVYQSYRKGDFSYRIDSPEGKYEVELLMADVSRPAVQLANLLDKGNSEKASARARFDVTINGKKLESGFSPSDSGHFLTAFKRRYIIDNSEGYIDISLRGTEGTPFLSGIKIRRL